MHIILREQTVSQDAAQSAERQEFHELCATYRLCRKQAVKIKKRIYSLLTEKRCRFTTEEIFDRKNREKIRNIEDGTALTFQLNMLFDLLEFIEMRMHSLKENIQERLNRICVYL